MICGRDSPAANREYQWVVVSQSAKMASDSGLSRRKEAIRSGVDAPLGGSPVKRLVDLPEINVALFAFLLNLVWEFAQVPLYRDLPSSGHWASIKLCARATLGDAVIAVVAFWVVAAVVASRRWITAPSVAQVACFVGVGLGSGLQQTRAEAGARHATKPLSSTRKSHRFFPFPRGSGCAYQAFATSHQRQINSSNVLAAAIATR